MKEQRCNFFGLTFLRHIFFFVCCSCCAGVQACGERGKCSAPGLVAVILDTMEFIMDVEIVSRGGLWIFQPDFF